MKTHKEREIIESLKPCPFCGGSNLRIMGGIGKYVNCRDCNANSGHLPGGACSADESTAAEAWNTRDERTCEDISTVHGKFVCGECGCVVRDTSAIDNGNLNYCPDCGAEVSNL